MSENMKTTNPIHWNYFLTIEKDLEHLSRYVEFAINNYGTFSIEMARLLLVASSEIDVLMKSLCQDFFPDKPIKCIHDFIEQVPFAIPEMHSFRVTIPRHRISFCPWVSLSHEKKDDKVPEWWNAYNKVKHQRAMFYQKANLFNTISSIGALFILNLYFYKDEANHGKLSPLPVFYDVTPEHSGGISINKSFITRKYRL